MLRLQIAFAGWFDQSKTAASARKTMRLIYECGYTPRQVEPGILRQQLPRRQSKLSYFKIDKEVTMTGNDFGLLTKRLCYWLTAVLLFSATVALAQSGVQGARARPFCDDGIKVSWTPSSEASGYRVVQVLGNGETRTVCETSSSFCKFSNLGNSKNVTYFVDQLVDGRYELSADTISGTTYGDDDCIPRKPPKTPTPKPSVDTCSHLPADIVVRNFDTYTTQCKRVGAAGVGDADLIAQGILDAVDIWQIVDSRIQVCFRNPGTLRFLDATTSPRAISELPAQIVDGMTCGIIDRPGTVALMESTEPIPAVIEAPQQAETASEPVSDAGDSAPEPPDTQAESAVLRDCQLTTFSNLSLRGGSSIIHARLAIIPRDTPLDATFREGDWYRVVYEEQIGWVNGAYVIPGPGCGVSVTSAAPADAAPSGQAEVSGTPLSDCALRASNIINLRAGPGLDHAILAVIPYRTVMRATERLQAWYKVGYQGTTGWVNIGYVARISDCS